MATLTSAQRTQLEADLARLKLAEMSFLTGERANRINYSERGIGFTDVDLEDIQKKICEIEDKLAVDAGTSGRRRPFSVQW